jgi:hypothetical protein
LPITGSFVILSCHKRRKKEEGRRKKEEVIKSRGSISHLPKKLYCSGLA